MSSADARPRRRGPHQMPRVRFMRELRAAVVQAAAQGDPYPFIFAPPLGPLRRAVQAPLPSCPAVLRLLTSKAARDPSARVRRQAHDALRLLGATG